MASMGPPPPPPPGVGCHKKTSSRVPIKSAPGGFPSSSSSLLSSSSSSSSSSQVRRAMTERRHELSNAIRKARRGHVVARKRRLGGSGGRGVGSTEANLLSDSSNETGGVETTAFVTYGAGVATGVATGTSAGDGLAAAATAAETPTSSSYCPSVAVSSSLPNDPASLKLVDLVQAYVRSCRQTDHDRVGIAGIGDAGRLSALQSALAKSDVDCRSIDSLLNKDGSPFGGTIISDTPAFILCEALSRSLSSPLASDEVRLDAARILTNLAATGGRGQGSGGEDDYYGPSAASPESWCDSIVRSSALPALIGAVDAFPYRSTASSSSVETAAAAALCAQAAWALGNVGGDSQRARDAARSAGAIGPLVRALREGFRSGRRGGGAGASAARIIDLCRNAAWALSNLARGTHTSALPFLSCSSSSGDANGGNDGAFTAGDLAGLIAAEEVVWRESGARTGATATKTAIMTMGAVADVSAIDCASGPDAVLEVPDATWIDVANESAWVAAFLSAREDAAVDALFGSADGGALCRSLAYRLSRASVDAAAAAGGADPGGMEKEGGEMEMEGAADRALRMCVPCVRAVGNAAAACDGRHVGKIILASDENGSAGGGGGNLTFSPLPVSLARLIRLGSDWGTGSYGTVASEAAWAAGTLLCDAGLPHPSTAVCDVLLPALCGAVVSGSAKLDLKREAVAAIGNAIAAPPTPWEEGMADPMAATDSRNDEESLPVRRRMLRYLAEEVNGFIFALTRLLLSPDADAMYAAVQIVDAMVRNLDDVLAVRRKFEEANLPDALESVCDRASAESSYGQSDRWVGSGGATERSAEIAADLIDDFFEEEVMSTDEAEAHFSVGTTEMASGEMRYAFGTETADSAAVGGRFDFGGGVAGPTGQTLQVPQSSGLGRGRGRGKVMPAWMQQQR